MTAPTTVTLSSEELMATIRLARKEGADSVHLSKMFGGDRIAFIREAAIALYAKQGLIPEDAWTIARTLWDTKPEDC